MNKEQIDKEFDEQFSQLFSLSKDDGIYYGTIAGKITYFINENEQIKHFIHQQIKKVIDELVGEKIDSGLPSVYATGYNQKRDEIIKKAQEMDYNK